MSPGRAPNKWAPPRPSLIALLIILLFVENVFDAVATLRITAVGAPELNPVMAWMLAAGPWQFVIAKLSICLAGALFLAFWSRRRRLAWIGLCLLALVYGGVALFHLWLMLLIPA